MYSANNQRDGEGVLNMALVEYLQETENGRKWESKECIETKGLSLMRLNLPDQQDIQIRRERGEGVIREKAG